jgi:hypothetical protein
MEKAWRVFARPRSMEPRLLSHKDPHVPRSLRVLTWICLAPLMFPAGVQAQWRQEPRRFETYQVDLATTTTAPRAQRLALRMEQGTASSAATPRPLGLLMLAGAGGALAGWYLGAAVAGRSTETPDSGESLVGAALGEALGIPLATSAANGFRGSFIAGAVTSTGIGALGVIMVAALHDGSWETLLAAVPVAQILFTAMMEHSTTR